MYKTQDAVFLKMHGHGMTPTVPDVGSGSSVLEVFQSDLPSLVPLQVAVARWLVCQPRVEYGQRVGLQAITVHLPGNVVLYKVPTLLYAFKNLCRRRCSTAN